MLQVDQAGKTQGRGLIPKIGPRLREGGKFGIRSGDDDNISRGLAQIDRFGPVVDIAGLGGEQVHQTRRP